MKSDYFSVDLPIRLVESWEPGTGTPTHLSIRVYQNDGGPNFYGQYSKRGVYISASPEGIEDRGNGFVSRSFFLSHGGAKLCLEENKRKNPRRGAILATEVQRQLSKREGPAWDLVARVMAEEHLELCSAEEKAT